MTEEDEIDWQATMFQPVGGMDQIPMAFKKKLGSVIRQRAEVVQIRQNASGVKVVYQDLADRQARDRKRGLLRLRLAADHSQNHGYRFLSRVESSHQWLFL